MSDEVAAAEAQPRKRGWIRLVVIVAVIAIVIIAIRQTGVFEGSLRDQVVRFDEFFKGLGVLGPLVFMGIWVAVCIFLLPGLPVSIVGGLVFGAVWGSVWTTIGANLGAAAAFLVGRYAARDMVAGWVEKNKTLRKIDEGVKKQGWRMLMITRLVPLFPFNLQNYVYGLTKIPFSTYVLVTFPTMIPATIAFNFAAGSAREVILSGGQPEAVKKTILYLAIAAVAFVLLSLIPSFVKKRVKGAEELTEDLETTE